MSSSMPDKSVVYHGEGMFCRGPAGALVNRSCPFLARVVDPLWMSSLEQVRRWIMQVFHISEATHRLALRHIVAARTAPSAPRYQLLVDITGEDAWAAFLDLRSRRNGSFVLYAQWQLKAPAPAPAPAPGAVAANAAPAPAPVPGAAAAANAAPAPAPVPGAAAAAAEQWPACKHGKPCTIETDWGSDNAGRRFYRCRLFVNPGEDCGFTRWLDDKFPEQASKHINRLLTRVDCLDHQVENLQEELVELHRRRTTSGDGHPPLDGQDSEERPRQVRRLATDGP